MNIVQVYLLEDRYKNTYTYKVPDTERLKKGNLCVVKNTDGKKCIARCLCDSEFVSDNILGMITRGEFKVTANVIGRYEYIDFDNNTCGWE